MNRLLFKSNKLLKICHKNFSSKMSPKWKNSMIVGGALVATFGVVYKLRNEKIQEFDSINEDRKKGTYSIGSPLIGGEFDLIDHNGNKKSDKDFLGKWLLMYFGFCNCPDICPDQIDKIIMIVERLSYTKDLPTIHPFFVTVDPERDSPQILKEYLKEFSNKITGLTGTKEKIEAITKAYRIYYSKGPKDQYGDYIVDHSIIMYLIGPNGEFVQFYGQNKTVKIICKEIEHAVRNYKPALKEDVKMSTN